MAVARNPIPRIAAKQQEKMMSCSRWKMLDSREMQETSGGIAFVQSHVSTSLVNYDWLKNAAAKMRANLKVLPPIGPAPHR